MVFLQTDRLKLRNVEQRDAGVMFDYRNNELCARYQRGQTKDLAGIDQLIRDHCGDLLGVENNCLVAVENRETSEMVGEIVVMPCEGTISFGYTFHYCHHRKGYACEALGALIELLHGKYPQWDFICFTDPDNTASRNLLVKLGFQDRGYLASRSSQIYGKWLRADSEAEIAAAIGS